MGNFGTRIKREREMRGITLEEIASATKIGTRSLQALEDEQFDRLPGGIFNKGFVRAYAKYLGIDEEQAVADFLAASGAGELEAAEEEPETGGESRLTDRRVWLPILAVVLLVLAAFAAWRVYAAGGAALFEGIVVQVRAPKTATAVPAGDRSAPAVVPVAATKSDGGQTRKQEEADTATAREDDAGPAESAGDGIRLHIRALQDAWIAAEVDGERQEWSLHAAAEKQVYAQERVVLTVGNAGGVEISYNDEVLPVLGQERQVRTLTFTRDGWQP